MTGTPPPVKTTSLSDAEVALVVAELGPRLVGATVGKVYESGGHSLSLEIGKDRLVVSAHPRASRLHLQGARPPSGGAPSGFAMLLRKRLTGLRLAALRVVAPGERVVELDFGRSADGVRRDRLVAELTGPHANVFLVDGEDKIVASLRPTGSTTRPLGPGDPYTPPPPAPAEARWRGVNRFGESPGAVERVTELYDRALRAAAEEEVRVRLGVNLRREIERLARRERALADDRRKATDAQVYRKYGDLLLAHMHELPRRGAKKTTVPDDFSEGEPLEIPLDPLLDGRANAARYYKQFKRMAGGLATIDARIKATRAAIESREAQIARLPGLDGEALTALAPALARAVAEAGPSAPHARGPRGKQAPGPRLPYREYRSLAGDPIWVGRGAADNDTLTFKHARGNDLWLHVSDSPGPHVVVPLRQRRPVSEGTRLDAALLAAHFSPLGPKEAQIDVSYTFVKNLRKPKGIKAGAVYMSETKTIRVRMDPVRLERIITRSSSDELTDGAAEGPNEKGPAS